MTSDSVGYVASADSRIYYERIGASDGVPLFMLSGGPGFDHSYFRASDVWEQIAVNRPVIFYDQRGTGKSVDGADIASCTLANYLADLEAVRQHLDYTKVDMLGHSWGGLLGMAYTARQPENVRRLILVDSAAPRIADTTILFKDVFPETVERQEALAYAIEFGDEKAIQAYTAEYMSMLFYSEAVRDAILSKVDLTSYVYQVNEQVYQDVQRYDLNPELGKFRQPTLVITGRYDINVAASVAYGIHKAIPNSRLEVFSKSGHLPFFEEPAAFIELVEQFLSET